MGVALLNQTGVLANATQYCEVAPDFSKWTVMSGQNTNPPMTLWLGYSPPRFLGTSKPMSADNLKFTDSADAQEQQFYHIWVEDLHSTDSATTNTVVTIYYTVVFSCPKTPNAS